MGTATLSILAISLSAASQAISLATLAHTLLLRKVAHQTKSDPTVEALNRIADQLARRSADDPPPR